MALEVLSRLILRVKPELVVDATGFGTEMLSNKGRMVEHRSLAGPIGNLFETFVGSSPEVTFA